MSMSKLEPEAGLPAPLSLTLDEVRDVAGGTLGAVALDHIWWYGRPAWANLVSQINQVTVSNVQVAASNVATQAGAL